MKKRNSKLMSIFRTVLTAIIGLIFIALALLILFVIVMGIISLLSLF